MSTNPFPPHFFRKMSIRTKLRLSAAVTVGLALAVTFTVSLQYRNVSQAARTERFAQGVIKDVSDLNSLNYEYLLLKDKRPGAQWQLKHASLGRVLSEHVTASVEEQRLLARLRSNHEQLKRLFDAVSERVVKGPAGAETSPSQYDELSEGITAQLMARAEMMGKRRILARPRERTTHGCGSADIAYPRPCLRVCAHSFSLRDRFPFSKKHRRFDPRAGAGHPTDCRR